MPQSWDMGQILSLPLRRKACWGLFGHQKNPMASAEFEPATRGPEANMLTSRPLNPVNLILFLSFPNFEFCHIFKLFILWLSPIFHSRHLTDYSHSFSPFTAGPICLAATNTPSVLRGQCAIAKANTSCVMFVRLSAPNNSVPHCRFL